MCTKCFSDGNATSLGKWEVVDWGQKSRAGPFCVVWDAQHANKYGLPEPECQFRLYFSVCDGVCIEPVSRLRLLGHAMGVGAKSESLALSGRVTFAETWGLQMERILNRSWMPFELKLE